ncbi:MAG: tetratricopeptide repeat protein, partial [Erysipelotrichaceae bacterium]
MKKNKKMQNVLLRLILVAISITVFFEVCRQSTPLSNISLEGYGWVSMVRTALIDEPVKNFANTIYDFTHLWAMKEENDALRKQIRLLAIYQARLEESYREIQALKALNDLKKAAELDPEFTEAYILQGDISAENREYEKAIDFYQKAIKTNNPFSPNLYYILANIQLGSGRYSDAR